MTGSEGPRSVEDRPSEVGVVQDGELWSAAAVVPPYATWQQRVVAAILDNSILAGATWLAVGTGFTQPTLTPGYGAAGDEGWPSGPMILVPIGALAILLVLQAVTGWTPGKLVVGIRVLRERSAVPAGLWTTLVRWVLHLLDAILLIGYLRPLWHEKRQTFADGIAHTVVVRQLPDLPRRHRIVVYSAALVAVVLGLGYGCVPINSVHGLSLTGDHGCRLEGPGPYVTTGNMTLDGYVEVERDRRMWTVRETRSTYVTTSISWTSDPSVRDVDHGLEVDVRPRSENGTPVITRSWDIGTGEDGDGSSEDGSFTHTRSVSSDADTHEAQVEITGFEAVADVGTDLYLTARLTADGETVAECGGSLTG